MSHLAWALRSSFGAAGNDRTRTVPVHERTPEASEARQSTASDPLTFVAVAAVLLAVAAVACYIPGRRASSLNPLEALREE